MEVLSLIKIDERHSYIFSYLTLIPLFSRKHDEWEVPLH